MFNDFVSTLTDFDQKYESSSSQISSSQRQFTYEIQDLDESMEMMMLDQTFSPGSDEYSHIKKEKNIVSYLRQLGLKMKTDPMQKYDTYWFFKQNARIRGEAVSAPKVLRGNNNRRFDYNKESLIDLILVPEFSMDAVLSPTNICSNIILSRRRASTKSAKVRIPFMTLPTITTNNDLGNEKITPLQLEIQVTKKICIDEK